MDRVGSIPSAPTISIMKYITVLMLVVLLLSGDISNNLVEKEGMKKIETGYTVIKFNDEEIVSKFADKICYGMSLLGAIGKTNENIITTSVDGIFRKVEVLLGIDKSFDQKVIVNVYDTKQSLKDAFYQTYKYHTDLRAWYSFHLNTVFCTVEDIDSGMLAHELGHAIVDNYFGFKPPTETAEILSKHVDTHLYD